MREFKHILEVVSGVYIGFVLVLLELVIPIAVVIALFSLILISLIR